MGLVNLVEGFGKFSREITHEKRPESKDRFDETA